MKDLEILIPFIRDYYKTADPIPLHAPHFKGREIKYVKDSIESSFVSSIGYYAEKFENDIATYTSSDSAIACVNGTSALHICLHIAGVCFNDLVITQPLTFVGTCNAIKYCGADPIFIDVDIETLSLSPQAMDNWLEDNAYMDCDGNCRYKPDNRKISACVPVHTFGHPSDIEKLLSVAKKWGLSLIEDAAESLGSLFKNKHTGTFGMSGAISFNGNKIITTGGGGMILTKKDFAYRAKHLTTTAKVNHNFEYIHNEIGFNYRLPSINAALGCAQLEQIEKFVSVKRKLAQSYENELSKTSLKFIKEPKFCRSNYWLNAVLCETKKQRDDVLNITNRKGIMTRPIWKLMCKLDMYKNCLKGFLDNALYLEERVVNLPSSVYFD